MKKLMFALLFVMSWNTYGQAERTTAAIPKNLHIFSENGNAYVAGAARGCSLGSYILPSNHPRFDEIFSILLTAQVAEKQVEIRFNGCNEND